MRSLTAAGLLLCLTSLPSCAFNEEFAVSRVDAGVYRGRPPRSPAEFERLRSAGVKTILDLQIVVPQVSLREERLAAEYGITYRHYPVSPFPGGTDEIEGAYRLLLRKQDYPIYIHCYQGRDRTGLLVGLYRVRCQGWQPKDAYDEMTRSGMHEAFTYFHRYFWDNARGPSVRGAAACPAGAVAKPRSP